MNLRLDTAPPIRIAVIGAGLIGRKHAKLIAAQNDCSLAGICDLDPNRRPLAERLAVPFYRDLKELLEQENPEGAIISTPNDSHAAVSEVCARQGVHILVEKPIADNLQDASRIIRAAQQAGTRVLVGHHRRHNPLIGSARSIVQGGDLGDLVGISVLWSLLKPIDYYDVKWRCRRPGGGPTFINLIHELDTLRFICGEIRRVFAQCNSKVRQLEVEDSLTISLTFENGVLGCLLGSDTTPSPWSYEATTHENPYYWHSDENCYYFLGTSGSLSFPRMELWSYAKPDRRGWQHPLRKSCREVAPADPLQLQLEHFCQIIRNQEEPLIDGVDGSRSLAVALAVLESMERQIPIVPQTVADS